MTLDPDPLYVPEPERTTTHEGRRLAGTIAAACLLGCAVVAFVLWRTT